MYMHMHVYVRVYANASIYGCLNGCNYNTACVCVCVSLCVRCVLLYIVHIHKVVNTPENHIYLDMSRNKPVEPNLPMRRLMPVVARL